MDISKREAAILVGGTVGAAFLGYLVATATGAPDPTGSRHYGYSMGGGLAVAAAYVIWLTYRKAYAAEGPPGWSSVNGIGTTLYGQREFARDGSYLTTQFVVFVYLPILPVCSFRVRPAGQSGLSRSYAVLERRRPSGAQVGAVYGFALGAAAAAVGFFAAFDRLSVPLSVTLVVGVTAVFIALPTLLRHRAKSRLS